VVWRKPAIQPVLSDELAKTHPGIFKAVFPRSSCAVQAMIRQAAAAGSAGDATLKCAISPDILEGLLIEKPALSGFAYGGWIADGTARSELARVQTQ
jgi:hypothetical protein